MLPFDRFRLSACVAGLVILCFSVQAQSVVTLTTTDNSPFTSFTNSLHWSDSQFPHGDADYLVSNGLMLRTPESSGSFTFAGRSLTLSNAYVNLKGNGQITVNDLRTYSCRIANGINGSTSLYGTNTVYGTLSGYSRYSGSADRVTYIYSILLGSGELSFDRTDGETAGSFYADLRGDNSAFLGGMRVVGPNVELRLADTNSLGGTLAEFRANALTLMSSGIVYAASSLTLDTHANRGITLSNGGVIRMASPNVLTLSCPIAGNGGLTVKGDGRVVFDAPFTYAGDTVIEGGTLCLSSAFALPAGTNALVMRSACRYLEGTGTVGNVIMEGGAINPATGTDTGMLTISNLTFNGGGLKYDFLPGATSDFVRVTGALSNALTTPIPVTLTAFVTNECPAYPLLTAPNLGDFTTNDFALARLYPGLPDGYLEIRQTDGTNTLWFVQTHPVVLLTASDPGGTTSYTNGTRWSDGALPTPDKDYWVAGAELRSVDNGALATTFPGHSLTLTAGSHKIKNLGVTINDFRLRGGTLYQGGGTTAAFVAGTSTVDAAVSSPFNFEIETSPTETAFRQLTVRSVMRGTGDIRFRYTPLSGYPYGGIFVLAATNTAFVGGISVCGYKDVELRISDERNLGANPSAFRADQLRLLTNGVLFATASLALDDANRGITLDSGGVLRVETNDTLTVANPITGAGKLTLRGAGITVLSGTNTYWGGTLVESNATLEVRSPWALGSNAVSVASNAVFRVPLDAAALPLGVRLGGTTPLTVADTLRVAPEFASGASLAKAFNLPVFLLTQTTAFDTSAVTPVNTPPGYTATVATRTVSDDGTSYTQVYIHYRFGGLIILVQ